MTKVPPLDSEVRTPSLPKVPLSWEQGTVYERGRRNLHQEANLQDCSLFHGATFLSCSESFSYLLQFRPRSPLYPARTHDRIIPSATLGIHVNSSVSLPLICLVKQQLTRKIGFDHISGLWIDSVGPLTPKVRQALLDTRADEEGERTAVGIPPNPYATATMGPKATA